MYSFDIYVYRIRRIMCIYIYSIHIMSTHIETIYIYTYVSDLDFR